VHGASLGGGTWVVEARGRKNRPCSEKWGGAVGVKWQREKVAAGRGSATSQQWEFECSFRGSFAQGCFFAVHRMPADARCAPTMTPSLALAGRQRGR